MSRQQVFLLVHIPLGGGQFFTTNCMLTQNEDNAPLSTSGASTTRCSGSDQPPASQTGVFTTTNIDQARLHVRETDVLTRTKHRAKIPDAMTKARRNANIGSNPAHSDPSGCQQTAY